MAAMPQGKDWSEVHKQETRYGYVNMDYGELSNLSIQPHLVICQQTAVIHDIYMSAPRSTPNPHKTLYPTYRTPERNANAMLTSKIASQQHALVMRNQSFPPVPTP